MHAKKHKRVRELSGFRTLSVFPLLEVIPCPVQNIGRVCGCSRAGGKASIGGGSSNRIDKIDWETRVENRKVRQVCNGQREVCAIAIA